MITKKLRLGLTFLRLVLCVRQNATGVGLIKISVALVILASKLHISNLRVNTRVSMLIRIN